MRKEKWLAGVLAATLGDESCRGQCHRHDLRDHAGGQLRPRGNAVDMAEPQRAQDHVPRHLPPRGHLRIEYGALDACRGCHRAL